MALVHDHDPVRHAQHLGQFGRNHDHGDAVLRQPRDQAVNFGLRADVDAARRLVEDQDPGLRQQPARDQHLLLVPAREVLDPLLQIRGLHPQPLAHLLAQALHRGLFHETGLHMALVQRGDLHVLEDRELQEAAGVLAVLGQQRHALAHRIGRRGDGDRAAIHPDRAGGGGRDPEDRLRHIGAPRPHQPGKAQDLAPVQLEADIVEHAREAEVLDLQDHIADLGLFLREHLGDLAPDHHPDDVVAGHIAARMGADIGAIAEHRKFIGDLEQLVHLVGDIDDAHALGLQVADDAEQVLHLGFGDRRGRLVHDQHIGFVAHRLGDLHHLPLRDRQRADLGRGRNADAQLVEQRLRPARHFGMVDQAEGILRLAPDPDILGHRHPGHQRQFLVDHGDAALQRIERPLELHLLARKPDRAAVGRINPGDDLHQRGFARAILAHQRMHGAGLQPELDIVERHHAREFLANAFDLEDVGPGLLPHPLDRLQCSRRYHGSPLHRLRPGRRACRRPARISSSSGTRRGSQASPARTAPSPCARSCRPWRSSARYRARLRPAPSPIDRR